MLEPARAHCKQAAEQSLIHNNTQSSLKARISHTSVRNNVATLPVIYQRSRQTFREGKVILFVKWSKFHSHSCVHSLMLTNTRRDMYPNQCIQASKYENPGSLSGTPWQIGQGMPPIKSSSHVLASSCVGDSDVGLCVPLSNHLEVEASVTPAGPPPCLPVWMSWEAAHRLGSSVLPIQVLTADIALINLSLLLLWVVAHPDFSTPAPLVTLLRFLLQFSTC